MRIHESFVQRETDAPMFSRGSTIGWRKTFTAMMLMAGATAIGLAQHHDGDDAFKPFLPLQVSTIPSNGDTTPYGLAFVPKGFPEREDISTGTLLVSNFNSSATPGAG